MTEYDIHTYADLEDAIRDGATVRDTTHVLGPVAVPADAPALGYRVECGGSLVIASSIDSAVSMAGGVLRIVYDRYLALTLYGSNIPSGHVELVDFPDGDADAVARVGAPYEWEIVREGGGIEGVELPAHYTRLGRKGDSSRRIADLRKARAYLDRAIAREEARGEK